MKIKYGNMKHPSQRVPKEERERRIAEGKAVAYAMASSIGKIRHIISKREA